MKNLLILGAGTAGTMVANRLNNLLDHDEWKITIVDQHETHYYQPGFLFIPFGVYGKKDVIKPKRHFIPPHAKLVLSAIELIEPDHNRVRLSNGTVLNYDFLVIATGADIHPDETPGLGDKAGDPKFSKQFAGKSADNLEVVKTPTDKNIQATLFY